MVLCLVRVAEAQPDRGPEPPQPPARIVELVATTAPATADVEALIDELLRQFAVTLHWTRVPAIDARDVLAHRSVDAQIIARVWLDLTDGHRAYLYVANASERFVVRAVPLASGYDEVARESLAHIVESVVDALLSGADIGVSREMAERQLADRLPPPTVMRPPRRRKVLVAAAALYRVGTWSRDAVHQPGLAVGIAANSNRRVRLSAWLWASYIAPFTWADDRAGAAFTGLSVRLTVGVEAKFGSRTTLRALVGPGIDALRVESRPSYGILAVRPFWVPAPMATLVGVVDVRLRGPLSLFAAVGIDADLAGTHYDIVLGNDSRLTTLTPWPLRPFGMLGFGITR